MSSADVIRQAKIKTSSLKRLHKELAYYEKERDREASRFNKLKEDQADPHDLRQAENVLKESEMMIPETRQRLEAALADLQSYLKENDQDISGSEEAETAKQALAEVEALFQS